MLTAPIYLYDASRVSTVSRLIVSLKAAERDAYSSYTGVRSTGHPAFTLPVGETQTPNNFTTNVHLHKDRHVSA